MKAANAVSGTASTCFLKFANCQLPQGKLLSSSPPSTFSVETRTRSRGRKRIRHLAQVVVELMITSRKPVHVCSRDGSGIEVSMRGRGSLVLPSVKHMHRYPLGQLAPQVVR